MKVVSIWLRKMDSGCCWWGTLSDWSTWCNFVYSCWKIYEYLFCWGWWEVCAVQYNCINELQYFKRNNFSVGIFYEHCLTDLFMEKLYFREVWDTLTLYSCQRKHCGFYWRVKLWKIIAYGGIMLIYSWKADGSSRNSVLYWKSLTMKVYMGAIFIFFHTSQVLRIYTSS